MESIRQYILSVICMVIVCGVVQLLFPGGTTASLVKLLSGLIVTITVLSPLLHDRILRWDIAFESLSQEGTLAVAEGKLAAEDAVSQLIMEKTQTYILNKASELGAEITVQVQLQDESPNVPEMITVIGEVSPYVRRQLAGYMSRDLGIAEEDQIWISKD